MDGFRCTVGNPAVSAMSRPRGWTTSFTVAAHSEKQSHEKDRCTTKSLATCCETVAQGEASDRAVQLARGSRDTAAEELVQSPETFVTTGSREPELAEDHDRADEAREAEVDEMRRCHPLRSVDS